MNSRCDRCRDYLTPGEEHDKLECAVATVVGYLGEHGHDELARAVAVATDRQAEERIEAAMALRRLLAGERNKA